MTEEKMDLYDFRREMRDRGIDEEEALESLERDRKKIHLLTFSLDNKKTNIVSYVNGKITFVDTKFPGKVEVGEAWICSVSQGMNGTVNYAIPIYKINATFLMNIDAELRDKMINSLWERHKGMFEEDFAERYKDEIHDLATREAKAELEGIINGLKEKVSYLENQLAQNQILNKSLPAVQSQQSDVIELSSEIDGSRCIELSSEIATVESEAPSFRVSVPPKIPSVYSSSTPGIPEIRIAEKREASPHAVFDVQRVGEETLMSESFTDHKYFVHISPDAKTLTIRPHDFGTALCINRKIRLKGLNKLSPFTEPKKLAAEYSERFEGLIVYL